MAAVSSVRDVVVTDKRVRQGTTTVNVLQETTIVNALP